MPYSLTTRSILGVKGDVSNNVLYSSENTIVYPSGNYLVQYNLKSKTTESVALEESDGGVTAMAISSNGRFVAVTYRSCNGSEGSIISIYNTKTLSRRRRVALGSELSLTTIRSLSFSSDDAYIAGIGLAPEGTLVVIDFEKESVAVSTSVTTNNGLNVPSYVVNPYGVAFVPLLDAPSGIDTGVNSSSSAYGAVRPHQKLVVWGHNCLSIFDLKEVEEVSIANVSHAGVSESDESVDVAAVVKKVHYLEPVPHNQVFLQWVQSRIETIKNSQLFVPTSLNGTTRNSKEMSLSDSASVQLSNSTVPTPTAGGPTTPGGLAQEDVNLHEVSIDELLTERTDILPPGKGSPEQISRVISSASDSSAAGSIESSGIGSKNRDLNISLVRDERQTLRPSFATAERASFANSLTPSGINTSPSAAAIATVLSMPPSLYGLPYAVHLSQTASTGPHMIIGRGNKVNMVQNLPSSNASATMFSGLESPMKSPFPLLRSSSRYFGASTRNLFESSQLQSPTPLVSNAGQNSPGSSSPNRLGTSGLAGSNLRAFSHSHYHPHDGITFTAYCSLSSVGPALRSARDGFVVSTRNGEVLVFSGFTTEDVPHLLSRNSTDSFTVEALAAVPTGFLAAGEGGCIALYRSVNSISSEEDNEDLDSNNNTLGNNSNPQQPVEAFQLKTKKRIGFSAPAPLPSMESKRSYEPQSLWRLSVKHADTDDCVRTVTCSPRMWSLYQSYLNQVGSSGSDDLDSTTKVSTTATPLSEQEELEALRGEAIVVIAGTEMRMIELSQRVLVLSSYLQDPSSISLSSLSATAVDTTDSSAASSAATNISPGVITVSTPVGPSSHSPPPNSSLTFGSPLGPHLRSIAVGATNLRPLVASIAADLTLRLWSIPPASTPSVSNISTSADSLVPSIAPTPTSESGTVVMNSNMGNNNSVASSYLCELTHLFSASPQSICLHPSGHFLFASFSECVKSYAVLSDSLLERSELPLRGISLLVRSHAGHMVAAAAQNLLYLFRVTSNGLELADTLRGHVASVVSIHWSSDDAALLSADESAVFAWDAGTGHRTLDLSLRGHTVRHLLPSPDFSSAISLGCGMPYFLGSAVPPPLFVPEGTPDASNPSFPLPRSPIALSLDLKQGLVLGGRALQSLPSMAVVVPSKLPLYAITCAAPLTNQSNGSNGAVSANIGMNMNIGPSNSNMNSSITASVTSPGATMGAMPTAGSTLSNTFNPLPTTGLAVVGPEFFAYTNTASALSQLLGLTGTAAGNLGGPVAVQAASSSAVTALSAPSCSMLIAGTYDGALLVYDIVDDSKRAPPALRPALSVLQPMEGVISPGNTQQVQDEVLVSRIDLLDRLSHLRVLREKFTEVVALIETDAENSRNKMSGTAGGRGRRMSISEQFVVEAKQRINNPNSTSSATVPSIPSVGSRPLQSAGGFPHSDNETAPGSRQNTRNSRSHSQPHSQSQGKPSTASSSLFSATVAAAGEDVSEERLASYLERTHPALRRYRDELHQVLRHIQVVKQKKEESESSFAQLVSDLQRQQQAEVQEAEMQAQSAFTDDAVKYLAMKDSIAALEKSAKQNSQNIIAEHNERLQRLQREMERALGQARSVVQDWDADTKQAAADTVITLANIEVDLDSDVESFRSLLRSRLVAEKEASLSLMGENGILKNKYKSLLDTIQNVKNSVLEKSRGNRELLYRIEVLEGEISHLRSIIYSRDLQISEKEKRIYELKQKNQELEKFKFVLDHNIKELKLQIEPREAELTALHSQAEKIDKELEAYRESNSELDNLIGTLRAKLNALLAEMVSLRRERNNGTARASEFVSILYNGIKEMKTKEDLVPLLATLKKRFQINNSNGESSSGLDLAVVLESDKQRQHLQTILEKLKVESVEREQQQESEISHLVSENLRLIDTIKEIREKIAYQSAITSGATGGKFRKLQHSVGNSTLAGAPLDKSSDSRGLLSSTAASKTGAMNSKSRMLKYLKNAADASNNNVLFEDTKSSGTYSGNNGLSKSLANPLMIGTGLMSVKSLSRGSRKDSALDSTKRRNVLKVSASSFTEERDVQDILNDSICVDQKSDSGSGLIYHDIKD